MSRILLVTVGLAGRSGTEIVCAETAHGLRRRGHAVSIYTQQDGAMADSLRADGFAVVTDLGTLASAPEVIQANQTFPLIEAVARFPQVPAISVCHDARVWFSEPIDLPSIRRHLAVDLACRDRIAERLPHLAARIEILRNAVDLTRFAVRAPLPARPRRALILAKQPSYLEAVRAACAQHGVEVDAVGPAAGDVVADLPARLRGYDLVFASARSALEAMAVGCAVIVIDGRGLAGLVTRDTVGPWRENNFGLRVLSRPVAADAIVAEIARYDAQDAHAVRDFIRREAALEDQVDRLERIHREVIAEAGDTAVDTGSLPQFLARTFRALGDARQRQIEAEFSGILTTREAPLHNQIAALQNEVAGLQDEFAGLQGKFAALQNELHAKGVEFRAYRDWVAPRNLPRRLADKLRRMLRR